MAGRATIAIAVTWALAGCHHRTQGWTGEVPPVVPREDRCGTGALTGAGHLRIQRMPYLQSVEPTAAVVAWAGVPEGKPRVVVGLLGEGDPTPIAEVIAGFPGTKARERAARRAFHAEDREEEGEDDDDDEPRFEAEDAADFYTLAAQVANLAPGRAYCYRIVDDTGPLTAWATLALAPAPDPDRVDRFVVLGDVGRGNRAQRALARRIGHLPMDAILFVGDLAYYSGTYAQFQSRFFDVYADLLRRVPAYAAIGNHDAETLNGRPFEDLFVFPGNERWYSFDLGDVHFVVLDTTQIGAAQAAWLAADLARAERAYTVILGHHPAYSGARRGPSVAFQETFSPIIVRHRVPLVIAGHEHHYERHAVDGVVYIVSGGGGATLTPVTPTAVTQRWRVVHHFLTLDAGKDALVVKAIDIDGTTFDEVRIEPRS
jgi:predicted phosphodiesterase